MSDEPTRKKNNKKYSKERKSHPKNSGGQKDNTNNEKYGHPSQLEPKFTTTEQSNNFKRETEEQNIVKTEVNAKYNKKEIQSNWHKYEIQESVEEVEEQQNLGADYEQLSQAPIAVGNHFQFKHEKSWDTAFTKSEFDKYFNINLINLALAIKSVPFYKRNSIDGKIFSDEDFSNMDHSANNCKQKFSCNLSATQKINQMDSQEAVQSLSIAPFKDTNPLESKLYLVDKLNNEKINVQSGKVMSDSDYEDIFSSSSLVEAGNIVAEKKQAAIEDVVLEEIPQNCTAVHAAESLETVLKQNTHENNATVAPQDLEQWLDDFLDN